MLRRCDGSGSAYGLLRSFRRRTRKCRHQDCPRQDRFHR
ncbi:hypothetical protein EVA_14317 [gut metagenome]|uniref:Uncharacterized protein n=1 Tax=gut metagenome TaxID=749906 RepID=J9G737_9ZZZZ